MSLIFRKTNLILLKVIPFVILVLGAKLLVHRLEYEFIPLNTIFSGIIGATVFLLGFLLSGVMSDYKESEKIPGEVAACLATLADEAESACMSKGDPAARAAFSAITDLSTSTRDWIHRKVRTRALLGMINDLNRQFIGLEPLIPANYVVRMKQEQNNLRKLVIRIHTIRETDFVSSAYLIGTSTSLLLMIGLVFAKIDPFHESLFFVAVISYLLLFLLLLIRDLDNPFGHSDRRSSEDVSLKPIEEIAADLRDRLARIEGEAGRVWAPGDQSGAVQGAASSYVP